MGDWPHTLLPPFTTINPWSMESLGTQTIGPSASATVNQNQAYYIPFRLDIAHTAVKMFCVNGATVNGNVDVGIYDGEFNYVISIGATAQSGTSVTQEFDITDTLLLPGNYWMALSSSSATATFYVTSNTDEIAVPSQPVYVEASAHPLPTTVATPVKSTQTSPIHAIAMGVAFNTLI